MANIQIIQGDFEQKLKRLDAHPEYADKKKLIIQAQSFFKSEKDALQAAIEQRKDIHESTGSRTNRFHQRKNVGSKELTFAAHNNGCFVSYATSLGTAM